MTKCFVLVDRDGNISSWGCVYATEELANGAIQEMREAHEESAKRSEEEQRSRFDREKAEHDALFAAGLRNSPFTREFRAYPRSFDTPKVEEWALFGDDDA